MAGIAKDSKRESFTGEIKVASRIIDYLSSGLYPSPAACLKELINNAYDADAATVNVYVKPDADRIVIEDDGHGMSKDEFKRHFDRISESHKRTGKEVTDQFRRPKIGKIGIGFIAANEICECMEIFSTKAGSTELLHVTINFSEMTKPLEQRRRRGGDIVKADYEGEILEAPEDEHYTHIFLEAVRGEAREILAGASTQNPIGHARSLYGKKPETIAELLRDPDLKSWKDFDYYSETMLKVALNVPVRYAPGWIPHKNSALRGLEREVERLKFRVFYDGTELLKPIVYAPGDRKTFVRPFVFKGKHVAAKGYFYAQHGSIKPQELHGLLVRIRNSAIGEFDPSFWQFTPSVASLIQRWVSVELWASDGLEDAMNIDRATLREAHPAYVELRALLHEELRAVFEEAKKRLYEAGSDQRKADLASEAELEIESALAEASLPARVSTGVRGRWVKRAKTGKRKAILRKYSVPEFYKILLEVADGILDRGQLAELIERVTERLSR